MNQETKILLANMDIAQLVIEREFAFSDETYIAGQLDVLPEDINEMRIQRVAGTLFKITSDENFVTGIVALLRHVYLPMETCTAEEIAGFS
jgi:hypothetical protein